METLSLKTIPQSQIISQAARVLRAGGLLIYPTETVYGLGADATNQKAVNKLLKFKGRRGLKPILIAVSDQKMAEKYVDLNDVARRLYQTFLPGPVAVVSKIKAEKSENQLKSAKISLQKNSDKSDLSDLSTIRLVPTESGQADDSRFQLAFLAKGIASPESTVGIRIPDYPLILKIIKAFGKPITSTSANISGAKNPWSIQDILETTPKQKLELIDLIIDAGQLPKRPPSTVIDTTHEETEIVRQGETNVNLIILNDELRITNVKTIKSSSEKQTRVVARNLISGVLFRSPFTVHRSPLVLALQGPMGAGKTVFAKGIARALGITAPIRSPSYTLVKEYPFPSTVQPANLPTILYHIDAWRLSDPQEFADLDLPNLLRPGNIIVIEWIDRLAPILTEIKQKAKIVLVEIDILDQNKRSIKITR